MYRSHCKPKWQTTDKKLGSFPKHTTARDYEHRNKGLIHCRQTLFLPNKFTQAISLLYLPFDIEDGILHGCYGYLIKSLANTSNTPLSKHPRFLRLLLYLPVTCLQCDCAANQLIFLGMPDSGSFIWKKQPYKWVQQNQKKIVFLIVIVVVSLLLLSPMSKSNCQGFLKRILCHKTRRLPRATGERGWRSSCSDGLNRAEVAPVELPGGTRSTLMRWQTHT